MFHSIKLELNEKRWNGIERIPPPLSHVVSKFDSCFERSQQSAFVNDTSALQV